MPTAHLPSPHLLAQALSITEAAVLVYSVQDPASLQLARELAGFMRAHFAPVAHPPSSSSSFSSAAAAAVTAAAGAVTATAASAAASPGSRSGNGAADRGRAYPIVLVGNKRDRDRDDEDDDGGGGEDGAVVSVVSRAAGVRAARGMGVGNGVGGGADAPFLEVSAKTGVGVEEVFKVVGREVLRVRRAVRERREVAERERLMSAAGPAQTAGGGEGRRRWRALWRALFGRGREGKR